MILLVFDACFFLRKTGSFGCSFFWEKQVVLDALFSDACFFTAVIDSSENKIQSKFSDIISARLEKQSVLKPFLQHCHNVTSTFFNGRMHALSTLGKSYLMSCNTPIWKILPHYVILIVAKIREHANCSNLNGWFFITEKLLLLLQTTSELTTILTSLHWNEECATQTDMYVVFYGIVLGWFDHCNSFLVIWIFCHQFWCFRRFLNKRSLLLRLLLKLSFFPWHSKDPFMLFLGIDIFNPGYWTKRTIKCSDLINWFTLIIWHDYGNAFTQLQSEFCVLKFS